MAFNLIKYDNDLLTTQFELVLTENPEPVSGFLRTEIIFQFPPILTSDQKSANWEEIDVRSYEPLMIWKGASARKISINFIYIVTGNGGGWTIDKINQQIQSIKAYFYRSMEQAGIEFVPHVELMFGKHVDADRDRSTWILESVQINPSGPLMIDDKGKAMHLKNEVQLSLAMATQITPHDGSNEGYVTDTSLRPKPITQWY